MKSMKPILHQPSLNIMPMLLLLAYFTYAAAAVDVSTATKSNNYDDEHPNEQIKVEHWGDSVVAAVTAWNVMVVTLEVNDFRHRLSVAYDALPSSSNTSNRYIASLIAVRYGLAHAIFDWFIMYGIGYAIVAGCTWTNAEPESVVVIQGFSVIFSAAILAVASFKFPQWLGVYRKSKFGVLKDTSNLAPQAVQDLTTTEGSTLKSFRYQVRLGVGKHFSQWIYFLLPFYVDLKIWWALLSVVVGWVFGYLVLFVVFKCRQRYKKHKERVAICAGIFQSVISALCFTRGMYIVQEGWQRDLGDEQLVFVLSFVLWLIGCLLLHGWKYYEHHHMVVEDDTEERATMFEDETVKNANNVVDETETSVDDDGDVLTSPNDLEEPLLERGLSSTRDSPYFESVYFNRVKFRPAINESTNEEKTPMEIYKDISKMEEANVKWYQSIWQFLPFQPAWKLFVMGTLSTFGCCRKDSDFKSYSCFHKFWFALLRVLKIGINCLALYVAIIACGATIQRSITLQRLPHSFENTYRHMNERQVCAFDKKCGELQTFESVDLAVLNNFTVAHCGPCAACSNWHDFPFQLMDLATPGRTCGQRNFFLKLANPNKYIERVQKCIEEDIGFSPQCSWYWANNVKCSTKNCAFIYLQSLMTNQVANFEVDANTITSATCSESACEAGPDYYFVKGVGANRRRMNIQSEIRRPPKEQCQIVGIQETSKGDADWEAFLNVKYNKDENKVSPLPICNERVTTS